MNIFELLFFLFGVILSYLFGRFFFRYIGWWGVLPGVILGFGLLIGVTEALVRIRPYKKPHRKE
jgi:hypothetical protein